MATKKQQDAEENYGEKTILDLDPDAERAATGDRDKSKQELENDGGEPGDTELLAGDKQEQGQITGNGPEQAEPKPYAIVRLESVENVVMWDGVSYLSERPEGTELIEVPDGTTVAGGYFYDRNTHEFVTPDEYTKRHTKTEEEE